MKFDATYVLIKSDTTYVAVDASTVTDAPVINFAVIKAVTA